MKINEQMINKDLKGPIDKIWNDFWSGGITNPLTVIEQFTYLIFLLRLDGRQLMLEKQANIAGIPIKDPVYTPEQTPLRWSSFKNLDPEKMFELFTRPQRDLGDLTAFDFMKNVGMEGGLFARYMKGATFMIPTPKLLDRVVQQIDKLPLTNRDAKGDLYEYMLSKIATAGQNGQFRTPRHIIRMMVQMMEPQKFDAICDPACGTAGFLVAATEYIHDQHQDWFNEQEFRKHYNEEMFNGMEFDATMLRIAAMNLQLHGIDSPRLTGKDSLSKSNDDVNEQYTLVLANPPFKGSLDYEEVESSLLQVCKTKKTELLFLALMLRILKPGGRCAVIVPDGVLFGSSAAHKSLRKELVENQHLQAIVSMPSGVFKPYAGVSTAILFFTKTNSGGTRDVWFYDMKADGLSLDDKRSMLLSEEDFENCFDDPEAAAGLEKVRDKCDIPFILNDWKLLNDDETEVPERFRDRTKGSFLVPKADIEANGYDLSINRYKEMVYEEVEYEKPEAIIGEIEALDNERRRLLESLKEALV